MKLEKQATPSQSEVYEYVGDGAGVPGLPHILSKQQATETGVLELLQAAIDNGTYQQTTEV